MGVFFWHHFFFRDGSRTTKTPGFPPKTDDWAFAPDRAKKPPTALDLGPFLGLKKTNLMALPAPTPSARRPDHHCIITTRLSPYVPRL